MRWFPAPRLASFQSGSGLFRSRVSLNSSHLSFRAGQVKKSVRTEPLGTMVDLSTRSTHVYVVFRGACTNSSISKYDEEYHQAFMVVWGGGGGGYATYTLLDTYTKLVSTTCLTREPRRGLLLDQSLTTRDG